MGLTFKKYIPVINYSVLTDTSATFKDSAKRGEREQRYYFAIKKGVVGSAKDSSWWSYGGAEYAGLSVAKNSTRISINNKPATNWTENINHIMYGNYTTSCNNNNTSGSD